jgi:hypothetical protein
MELLSQFVNAPSGTFRCYYMFSLEQPPLSLQWIETMYLIIYYR